MVHTFFDFKMASIAIMLSLVITLFIGCFANAPADMDESFSGEYWYYLNRGYPQAWAGVALAHSTVELPILKVPFITADDGRGTKLVKIIDLRTFAPIFLVVLLISSIPACMFTQAVHKRKKMLPIFILTNTGLLLLLFFIYFAWFSRV